MSTADGWPLGVTGNLLSAQVEVCLAVTSHSFCVQNVQNSDVLNLRIRVQTEAAVKHII